MAITYPLSTPTSIGIESIELRTVNAVATSESPFTYKQQIISHGGQRWEASVTIPTVRRDLAAPWKAMLIALKGQTGTFLLGDPDYATPQGTVSSCTLSGTAGVDEATVVMTGTLKAGDYIQLGSGVNSKLHQVLQDQSGNGTIQIWPSLRSTYSSATVVFNSPRGLFRLDENTTSWSINNSSSYGISFEAVEVIT
tara:strand:- start:1328 stop:1915 length:588 start_codon:yes stop_codon:yes gene_type:complete